MLKSNPDELRRLYESAEPFPHIVVDDFLDADFLREIANAFPGPDALPWVSFDNPREKKLGLHHRSLGGLPHNIRDFLHWMSSPVMLDYLQRLTGIDGLIPDPYFGGGGLHLVPPGGFLKIHADFNWHPILKLDRRLNALLYVNQNWEESWGGHLELWNKTMTSREQSIAPLFNRLVVFSTTDSSYHGHPEPLRSPAGVYRRSVSLYYYTNGRPSEERSAPHDTVFPPDM